MSYKKMMKWNSRHRKGIKQAYMGFNPSGITSEQIQEREAKFIAEWEAKTPFERNQYRSQVKEMKESWDGSWPWKWCAFERRFNLNRFEPETAIN